MTPPYCSSSKPTITSRIKRPSRRRPLAASHPLQRGDQADQLDGTSQLGAMRPLQIRQQVQPVIVVRLMVLAAQERDPPGVAVRVRGEAPVDHMRAIGRGPPADQAGV